MKDDSNLYEPLLEDGDHSMLIPVQRASYTEKLWGILPLSSSAWFDFPSRMEHGVACFSHKPTKEKSTMTQGTGLPVNTRTRALILVLTALILVVLALLVVLCIFFNVSMEREHSPSEDNKIGAEENMTVAVLVTPKYLSVAALLEANEQEHWGAMRNCLDTASQKFSLEPSMVRKNAKMILQCNGTRWEFLSGKGENHIEVVWINGRVSYTLDEASSEVHMARLGRHPIPLNLSSIVRVLQDLASQEGSEELQACLNRAKQGWSQESVSLQDNAKLVVSCGRKNLTFISGDGENEINVYKGDADKEIQCQVKATGWYWWARGAWWAGEGC